MRCRGRTCPDRPGAAGRAGPWPAWHVRTGAGPVPGCSPGPPTGSLRSPPRRVLASGRPRPALTRPRRRCGCPRMTRTRCAPGIRPHRPGPGCMPTTPRQHRSTDEDHPVGGGHRQPHPPQQPALTAAARPLPPPPRGRPTCPSPPHRAAPARPPASAAPLPSSTAAAGRPRPVPRSVTAHTTGPAETRCARHTQRTNHSTSSRDSGRTDSASDSSGAHSASRPPTTNVAARQMRAKQAAEAITVPLPPRPAASAAATWLSH